MSQVHNFPLITTIFPDTRLPLQYPGDSFPPAPRQIEIATLLGFIEANLNIASAAPQTATITGASTSVSIPAGRLVEKIVVLGSGAGTFNLGSTAGANNILDTADYDADGAVHTFDRYFHAAGALHFSAFSGTLTVKIYSR